MNVLKIAVLFAPLLGLGGGAARAQDNAAGHDMTKQIQERPSMLPERCVTEAGSMAAAHMPPMDMKEMQMDEGHVALMSGMAASHSDMMASMMVDDIDVAFICGMIPHHQAAINMAKVELELGDNEWSKQLAQSIINTQEKELAEMMAWLETQP